MQETTQLVLVRALQQRIRILTEKVAEYEKLIQEQTKLIQELVDKGDYALAEVQDLRTELEDAMHTIVDSIIIEEPEVETPAPATKNTRKRNVIS